MRAPGKSLLLIAAAVLALLSAGGAFAQKSYNRGMPPKGPTPGNYDTNRGYRGPSFGIPGIILTVPSIVAPDRPYVDDGNPPQRRQRQQRDTQRRPSNAAPASADAFVADEVLVRFADPPSARQITALERRYRLTRIDSWTSQLSGITSFRWRILGGRPVPAVVRELQRDTLVAFVQPNFLYALQEDAAKLVSEGDPAQYELGKLHLPQAHALAKGDNVLVAVIDSAIDVTNPELAGAIADTFDTLTAPLAAHLHGTAVAGLIAAHGKLMGAAPNAKILAVRAFDPKSNSAKGTTDNIRKGLAWAATNGARVINMSFTNKYSDPSLRDEIAAAHNKGIVLVAAAGNDGPKSPPLYPAAYPSVIAVAATTSDDRLFEDSSPGEHVSIAAPGEKILVVTPDGNKLLSGTSFSAAEISGIAALMLQHDPTLTPDRLRDILQKTARDLGPKGRDPQFGYGLADALAALTAARAPVAATIPLERASTRSNERPSTGGSR